MAQIKYEITEDSIDEINTSMQGLIEEADWLLNSIGNYSSHSITIDFDSSNASTSRSSMSADNAEPVPETALEPDTRAVPVSAPPNYDVGNDSSGSDTTIVCNNEEPSPGPSNRNSLIILGDNNSLEQEVIVIGTPTIERQRTRRVRSNRIAQNHDSSVIDLSNYTEMRRELPTVSPIIILSSDEENDEVAPAATIQQPSRPITRSSVAINNFAVSVHSSPAHFSTTLSVRLGNRQHERNPHNGTQFGNINHSYEVGDIRVGEPVPAPILNSTPPAPPSQPSPQQRATKRRSHAATEGTSNTMNIICPICYETLANQRAISTSCGHVFCSNCIQLSLQTAKKCPICNKKLTKASQMHPVYFSTG
ncbi:uncharacterized protein LOC128713240 [Anopheles marshallii]|uniref:uncharacterized protein LOC128713240 n=1 Tax=Anopheles marshallii TaxID=1521116 RepID=UPI00237A0DDF|nr:uncharacterized protein LOC128713240 [Anopheles marshallii]